MCLAKTLKFDRHVFSQIPQKNKFEFKQRTYLVPTDKGYEDIRSQYVMRFYHKRHL